MDEQENMNRFYRGFILFVVVLALLIGALIYFKVGARG